MSLQDAHNDRDGLFYGSMHQTLFLFFQEHQDFQNDLQKLERG